MKELLAIMTFAVDQFDNAKDGITTYEEDHGADHGDGRFSGRREAYQAIINECAKKIAAKTQQ